MVTVVRGALVGRRRRRVEAGGGGDEDDFAVEENFLGG